MSDLAVSGSQYTNEQRLAVITAYVITGSMIRAATQTGIPQSTLYTWRKQPWFADMVENVRREKEQELDGAFTRIISKALDAVENRLDHGDAVLIDGAPVRLPVKARDAALIAAIAYDKRALLRDASRLSDGAPPEDHLQRLAGRLSVLTRPQAH